MLSAEFEYYAPTDLEGAVHLLSETAAGGTLLAGGMSLMPAMNLGLTRPTAVVSLNHVVGIDYVREESDVLRIGATVRHAQIETDPLIQKACPALSEAASVIGDVQIRHRGTVGGSLAHADPAADYLSVMVAHDAVFTLAGAHGQRTVRARDFFVDVMRTNLRPGEILAEAAVPKLAPDAGSAYRRLARVEGSFAIVNAAAVVGDEGGVVAVGGATTTPFVVDVPEGLADSPSEQALEEIGEAATEAATDSFGDLSATADYRRAMAGVYARRAVEAAIASRRRD